MPKTVFITGASRGIGRATALLFEKNGYNVAACRCHTEIDYASPRVFPIRADVRDEVQVNLAVRAAEECFGRIDALVNCAGIAQQKLFADITAEDWRDMLAVCLDGAFYCCKAVLPGMIARGSGAIVNVSSVWGVAGASCEAHYSAAKAGLIGLTKALSREVGPSGVRVNCVAPGAVQTDMLAGFTNGELGEFAARTALCRIGTPGEIAEAIFFLADGAPYCTGQVLAVDGGLL